MAEKVTTVIAFVMVCVGFLALLALVVPILDAVNASSCRSRAAERRARWETRGVAARRVVMTRGRLSRSA
jgi:Tfp pilus assembly protein PilV